MLNPRPPPSVKRYGEQSRILWAYVPKSGKDQSDCKISNCYVALPLFTVSLRERVESGDKTSAFVGDDNTW